MPKKTTVPSCCRTCHVNAWPSVRQASCSCYSLLTQPLGNQQQTMHQRLPHPHIRAGVQGLLIASENLVDCAVPEWAAPDLGLSKGMRKRIAEVCVDWSCSRGLRWLGWESQNKTAGIFVLNLTRCTPGHQNLKAPVERFAWQACRVLGQMVCWVAQPKNCLQKFPKDFYSTSLCLLRPPNTAGLPSCSVWKRVAKVSG
eukprot:1155635-Pelagomonas_calceolata.AAC.20